MINPWKEIVKVRETPFILQKDKKDILYFNKSAKEEHKINIEILPDPYIGDVFKSKVVLLQLNPGIELPPGLPSSNEVFERELFPELQQDIVNNMIHKYEKFPFYYLNPRYRLTGGFRYWSRIFNSVIKKESDYLSISKNVCCIEFFPYHSKNFRPFGRLLESQKYSFYLLERAIERKSSIILLRGESEWHMAVPKLKKFFKPKSTRNPVLSEKNFPNCYKEILSLLKE